MSTINSSINFEIPGVGMVSPASYVEFDKLREGYESRKDIFNWKYNPYFLMTLYQYYRAIKDSRAKTLKKTIRSGWYHEGFKGMTVGHLSKEDVFTVEIEEVSPDGYFESRILTGNQAWEALRDLSLKVVLNYK